ncbi:lipopolysaccharide biosynthesis protein [Cryobacterium sp. Sr8]|uniref:lipopolysaccharide biosynthesis protein n=1 Tax=Cryobacterium sp. Sr8 TaxID=1259203 RepID=UPI00141B3A77|nr:oligosaccharide flippase family protein [Cryobacterium sp. Sr8]
MTTSGRALLGAGSLYALATVVPILSTLLITPFVTRALGPAGYGIVGISITLYQLGAVLLSFGLPAAITRHAIIARSGERGAAALVVIGSLAAAAAGAALIALIPAWGPVVLDQGDAWVLAWPVTSAVGLSALTLSLSFLRALDRVRAFVALSCVSAVLGPLLGFGSMLSFGASPSAFLGGLAIGHLVGGVTSLAVVLRLVRPEYSWADTFQNLRIGLPTVPHAMATSFLVSALVLLSSRIGGLEDAGRLQLALLLGTAPMVVLGAFNNAWAPMIYRATSAERSGLLSSSLRAISVLVFVLVGGFSILAQPVVAAIAGPELFTDQLLAAAIAVTAATPFMAVYLANMHLVFLSGRTALLAVSTPLSLALSLGLLVAISSTFETTTLAMFASGVPIFHALQWIMSGFLRKISGYEAPRILGALPALALSLGTSVLVAVCMPPGLLIAFGCSIAGALIVFFNRSTLRRIPVAAGG